MFDKPTKKPEQVQPVDLHQWFDGVYLLSSLKTQILPGIHLPIFLKLTCKSKTSFQKNFLANENHENFGRCIPAVLEAKMASSDSPSLPVRSPKFYDLPLHRQPSVNVVQLAYDIPEFLQRHIAKEGTPTDLWGMLDLANKRFRIRLTSGELAEMLRCAGVSMTNDKRGNATFSGFSAAFEVLSTARRMAESTRPGGVAPSKSSDYVAPPQLYAAALMLQHLADERLGVNETVSLNELLDLLVAKYPECDELHSSSLARQFYSYKRYRPITRKVDGRPQRLVMRIR